nr:MULTISPECIES: YjcZ family sporulation protein [unclassified Brevibacillus]
MVLFILLVIVGCDCE